MAWNFWRPRTLRGTAAGKAHCQDLAVLGLLVLTLTFLSFSLEVKIAGRWP